MEKKGTARNKDRFARLLEKSAPRAFRTALAILGEWHEAEDAVQEAALLAFQSLDQLRDERAFGAWFIRIVVNQAIDILRSHRRERDRLAALSIAYRRSTGPADLEMVMDVTQAVDRLTPPHRAVVRLYYAGGYTTPQIARMLDRPEGTVRRLLSESYRTLRSLLCATPGGRGSAGTSAYAPRDRRR